MLEGTPDDEAGEVAPYLEALYEAYLEALLEEGGNSMFARVVECQSKAGQGEQASNKLKNDVLPNLQKQPGFIDFLTLSDKTNPERLLCISFWTSREDADRYHRQHYDAIHDALRPVLEAPPILETFAVNVSTAHRIAADRAA
jgi:quinol monooxygenase YgiN